MWKKNTMGRLIGKIAEGASVVNENLIGRIWICMTINSVVIV